MASFADKETTKVRQPHRIPVLMDDPFAGQALSFFSDGDTDSSSTGSSAAENSGDDEDAPAPISFTVSISESSTSGELKSVPRAGVKQA